MATVIQQRWNPCEPLIYLKMERSALSHLKRAPSMNIHRGRLHALPPSRLTAVRHHTCGGTRRDLLFCPDSEVATSWAKPLWIGCKCSASGQIPAQPDPDGPTPLRSYPLDMKLVEAFRQPPEVIAIAAPKLGTWPAKGYKATKFDPTVASDFFDREDELKLIKKLVRLDCPENVILLLGPRSCGKTVSSLWLNTFSSLSCSSHFLIVSGLCAGVN